MSNTEELQNMVLQFKVPDLQSLLGFAGQNKNGRKTELQKKALHLIQRQKSIPLEMKVRNIYRRLVAEHAVSENRDDYYRSSFDKYNNCYQNNGYSDQPVSDSGFNSYGESGNYFSSNSDNFFDMWARSTNGFATNYNSSQNAPTRKFDYSNFMDRNTRIPTNDELKNVEFKKLSFFKFKSSVVPLTPMIPSNEHADVFEYSYTFNLHPQQQAFLSWAKKNGRESRYQIQLRLCLLDGDLDLSRSTQVGDSLPLALVVKVNDKNCQLPPAIPSTNKQGMLLKRMDAPVNLTTQTKKNPVNNLAINWSVESNKLYGFVVHLVKKYSSDELINELKDRGERDPSVTKKYLRAKLNECGDDDIAATSLKVSLVCPLGKILMTLPTRATTCNHLQCFDGALYIRMNEVKSTWQCPVCNKSCHYEDLFIDGYFARILREENFGSDVTDIQIEADGSVIPVVPKKRGGNASTEGCVVPRKKPKIEADVEQLPPPSPAPDTLESLVDSLPSFVPIFNAFSRYDESAASPDLSCDELNPSLGSETSSNGCDEPPKKDVVMVDLTETDSEPEDCSVSSAPLNLKKNDYTSTSSSSFSNAFRKNLPPVYDIDDSDNS